MWHTHPTQTGTVIFLFNTNKTVAQIESCTYFIYYFLFFIMLRTLAILLLLAGVIAVTAGYVRATAAAKCPPPQVVFRYLPPVSGPPQPMLASSSVSGGPAAELVSTGWSPARPLPLPMQLPPVHPFAHHVSVPPVAPSYSRPFSGASEVMRGMVNDDTVRNKVFTDAGGVGGQRRLG